MTDKTGKTDIAPLDHSLWEAAEATFADQPDKLGIIRSLREEVEQLELAGSKALESLSNIGIKDLEILSQSLPLAHSASSLIVRDKSSFDSAGEYRKQIKKFLDAKSGKIEEIYQPIVSQFNSLHKAALARKKRLQSALEEADDYLKSERSRYRADEEQRQQAMQAKAREDQLRYATEEAFRQAELLLGSDDPGDHELALDLIASADSGNLNLPAVAIRTESPKTEGISDAKLKRFEIIDENKIARSLMMPNVKAIQALVTQLGQAAVPIVGNGSIRVYFVDSERIKK